MSDPRAFIRQERQRMVQVRRALVRAMRHETIDNDERAAFYRACGDYMVYAQGRVHKEDQGIADRLKARVPASDTQEHERIDRLLRGLDISRGLTSDFAVATEHLKAAGPSACAGFERAVETLITGSAAAMGGGRNPMNTSTDDVMTETDWAEIAAATPDDIARESELYLRVQDTAPAGFDPATMPPTHPRSWDDY